MSQQSEKAPDITWPALRLVLALLVFAGGMFKAGQWFAAGNTIAATICTAAVLGFLAGLYPGEPGADDEQGGAV